MKGDRQMDNQEDVYGADIKRRVYDLSVNRKVPPIIIDHVYRDHGPGLMVLEIAEKFMDTVITPGVLKDTVHLDDVRKIPTLLEDISARTTEIMLERGETEKAREYRRIKLAHVAIRNVLEAYVALAETPQYEKLREHLLAMSDYANLMDGGEA